MQPLSLALLRSNHADTMNSLRDTLLQDYYAVISIDDPRAVSTLKRAVNEFDPEQTFRFPAADGESEYSENHKECFEVLYEAALTCTQAIWKSSAKLAEHFPHVSDAVAKWERGDFKLFGGNDKDSPFKTSKEPFAHSFFNIFNYDHGMLNEHKDRGLLTAIYIAPNSQPQDAVSQLWVETSAGNWVAMDPLVKGAELVVFVGEELEEMGSTVGMEFVAVEHSVRVSPGGQYVEYSHSRRDPDAQSTGNRKSAALVLCSSDL